jgi:hydrogenase nickel incorporation protein HypA/HybF
VHEAGFCDGVLHAVEDRAGGRAVARIGVRVGSLHRIVPAAFEQSFQLMAAGGVADGATTEVTIVPARGSCAGCGEDFATTDPPLACPHCGSFEVRASGGDELVLEWVEYRRPEGG